MVLACLFTVGVRISWKKLVGKGATKMSSRASYILCLIYITWEGEFEQNIAKIRLNIKDNT